MNDWSTQEIVIPNRRDSPENLRQQSRHRTDDSRALLLTCLHTTCYKNQVLVHPVYWYKILQISVQNIMVCPLIQYVLGPHSICFGLQDVLNYSPI